MSTVYGELNNPALIDGLKAGSVDAQVTLVKLAAPLLMSYLMKAFHLSPEDSEEIIFKVLYKVMRNIDQFDPARAKFTTWIWEIARSAASDFFKREQRRLTTISLDALTPKDIAVISTGVKRQDTVRATTHLFGFVTLRAAMEELGEDERRIVEWRINNISFGEIAAWLGKTKGSVKVAHFRALNKLRTLYQNKINSRAEL